MGRIEGFPYGGKKYERESVVEHAYNFYALVQDFEASSIFSGIHGRHNIGLGHERSFLHKRWR